MAISGKGSVEARGCTIEYIELGSGPSLVFLHGSGGFRYDERAFGALARDFHLFVPAMPGFDRSTSVNVNSCQDVADVMAEFIRAVAGERAVVAGESFGGRIAAWLGIRHPNVVERVIMGAPGGLRRTPEIRGKDTPYAELYALLWGRKPDRGLTDEEKTVLEMNLANAMRLGGTWDQELYDQLPNLSMPSLVLYGLDDRTLRREDIDLFVGRIPGAQIRYLEGVPHVISGTHPDEFATLVLEFCKIGRGVR